MGTQDKPLSGPDLAAGVALADVPQGGSLLGHAGGEAVLLVRPGGDHVYAIGATCTHYGGPLAEGLVTGGQVRCPWHHACFDVRTGEAVAAPAIDPLPCWQVDRRGDQVIVGERLERTPTLSPPAGPDSVIIVGAGAAGIAAAEMLRREGYTGSLTLIGADPAPPVDRPNLSKDFLAGNAPEEWVFVRPPDFYTRRRIELLLGTPVTAIDTAARTVTLADGKTRGYGALLLATGAEPIRLPLPGADQAHVHTLRSLADSRAIIAGATGGARRAVVVGASFIGLEVAASLRARNLEVTVVAPEARPLEKVLGPELGDFVRGLHEEHGVQFRLGRKPARIEADAVILDDDSRVPAELVVLGVGVRPALALAEQAGLTVDKGVVVDDQLRTSAAGVWAAGDIARVVDPRSGQPVRIEHWVVAERQGQTAARNMLGRGEAYRSVPFFWSAHYDVTIAYVGHAAGWDALEVHGDLPGKSAVVAYRSGGKIAAIASVFRDQESLQAELLLERDDQAGLEELLRSL